MSDLLEAHSPDTLRALFLTSHYRARSTTDRPGSKSWRGPASLLQGIRAVRTTDRPELLRARGADAPGRLHRRCVAAPPGGRHSRQRFLDAMDDDFNTGGAIGELYEMVHALNRAANSLTADSGAPLDQYKAA